MHLDHSHSRLSDFTFTFHFHALEKEMATHSSVLAWRIPGTGSLVGCRLWGHSESDMIKATQQQQQHLIKGGSDDKESTCSAGEPGSIPGSGRSSEEGNGYPLQYSCLENSMDRGAWWATVQGVTIKQFKNSRGKELFHLLIVSLCFSSPLCSNIPLLIVSFVYR